MGCLFTNKKNNKKISSIEIDEIDLNKCSKDININFFCNICNNPINEISKIHSESHSIVFKCQCDNNQEKYHKLSDISFKKDDNNKSASSDNNQSSVSSNNEMIDKNDMLDQIVELNRKILNNYKKYPNNYFHLKSLKNVANSFIEQTGRDSEELDWLIKGMKTKKNIQEKAKQFFHDKYKINLNGEEEELYFSWFDPMSPMKKKEKKINDEGFRLLSKIIFVQLKEIDLSGNEIKNTEYLYNMSLPYLEILDMSHNKIEDIEPIAELNCKELKELCLQHNKIKNFEPFLNSDFPKLKIFRIEDNINDKSKETDILKRFKDLFTEITETEFDKKYSCAILSEDRNKQKKIEKIDNNSSKVKLKDVRKLYLYDLGEKGNQIIKDLYYLIPKENKIKLLKIDNNEIDDISLLTRIPLYHLEELDLSLNKIKNLDFLSKLRFNKLKKLYLNHNNIYNIFPLQKLTDKESNNGDFSFFPELSLLSLNKNPLDDQNTDNNLILKNIKEMRTKKKEKEKREEGFEIDIYPDGHFETEVDD